MSLFEGIFSHAERGEASESLRGEEAKLTERLTWLEREVQALKDYLREQNGQAQSNQAEEAKQGGKPGSQAAKPGYAQSQNTKAAEQQSEGRQATEPDEQTAERWAREHLAEWLDAPCLFAKAQGRTWRQLANNQGPQITVKGKASSPRAYLHAIESWATCKVWARMKAKVALEVGKNGNGTHIQAIGQLGKVGRLKPPATGLTKLIGFEPLVWYTQLGGLADFDC